MRKLFIYVFFTFFFTVISDSFFNNSDAVTCRDFPDHPSCLGYKKAPRQYGSFPEDQTRNRQEEYDRRRNNECYDRHPIPVGGLNCR